MNTKSPVCRPDCVAKFFLTIFIVDNIKVGHHESQFV